MYLSAKHEQYLNIAYFDREWIHWMMIMMIYWVVINSVSPEVQLVVNDLFLCLLCLAFDRRICMLGYNSVQHKVNLFLSNFRSDRINFQSVGVY